MAIEDMAKIALDAVGDNESGEGNNDDQGYLVLELDIPRGRKDDPSL